MSALTVPPPDILFAALWHGIAAVVLSSMDAPLIASVF
jgi:hypothetical protein